LDQKELEFEDDTANLNISKNINNLASSNNPNNANNLVRLNSIDNIDRS